MHTSVVKMNTHRQPIDVGLNVTRRCNLRCSFCFYGDLHFQPDGTNSPESPSFDLPLDLAFQRLSQITIADIYLCGGEPLTYPHLRELVKWLSSRSRSIRVATNGLLLTDEWLDFFRAQNVYLLMSVKNAGMSEYQKILKAKDAGVKTHVYHVLNGESVPVLRTMAERYAWSDRVRLLYGTPSDSNSMNMVDAHEWLGLLSLACDYLKNIGDKVDIEIGFAPATHPIASSPRRGAVKRFYMDIDMRVYPCPLLVERSDGTNGLTPRDCDADKECPALSKRMPTPSFLTQICPFVLAGLHDVQKWLADMESAVKS